MTAAARIFVATVVLAASACASQNRIVEQYREMRPDLLKREWTVAAAKLEDARTRVYREQDRVMYWLNLGTLLHYAGDYERSMQNFIKAEETMREMWTKSISGEIARFVLNETSQGYPGEDHERVLIYLFTAMNRVKQGRIGDALVEARRADEQLKRMRIAYESDEGLGTVYRQDAFMLWLVGVFYEIEGSYNDAFLAYRRALQIYREHYARDFGTAPPSFIYEDLHRTGILAGLENEARTYLDSSHATGSTLDRFDEGWAEVVLVHGSGEAPFKREKRINAPLPDGYVASIALPELVRVPHEIEFAKLRVEDVGTEAETYAVEPVTRIALRQFQRQAPAIRARAIARAAVKYGVTKAASEAVKGGSDSSGERQLAGTILGLVGNIAAAATEAADLRAWTTLPADFGATRLWIPPGTHEIQISYHRQSGARVGLVESRTVTLVENERHLISVRSFR